MWANHQCRLWSRTCLASSRNQQFWVAKFLTFSMKNLSNLYQLISSKKKRKKSKVLKRIRNIKNQNHSGKLNRKKAAYQIKRISQKWSGFNNTMTVQKTLNFSLINNLNKGKSQRLTTRTQTLTTLRTTNTFSTVNCLSLEGKNQK